MFKRQFICSAFVVALGVAPGDGMGIPLPPALPATASADVVTEWNGVMLTTTAGLNPFFHARFAAITHAAIFEAVNAITGQYEPYLGTIQAPPGASPEAAAVAAAHAVLVHYFPAQASVLDARRSDSLGAIADGQSKTDGIAVGEAAAAAMIALRANDGSSPPQFYLPLSSNAGEWQLTTPLCPVAGGVFFHWQNVTPFGIQSASQFRSDPPPALTSSTYTKDYDEVSIFGASDSLVRAPDRSDVARFFNVVLAVGVWNSVAQQLAAASGSSLSENARAFALINMAISDGLVAVMETKYHYTFWRPETAIRYDDDGNPATAPNPAFTPFIATPCFPSYPSAHASASYAARRVVQEIWGAAGHSIELHSPSLNLTLQYTSLKQITTDIDDARVYGGIHFRFDQEAGALQGWRIGQYIMANRLQARVY